MTQAHFAHTALVMAGGTGGHIFPGLAVAEALRTRGWQVHWLGVPASMESRLVPPRGFAFEPVQFGGVRGKGRQPQQERDSHRRRRPTSRAVSRACAPACAGACPAAAPPPKY